MKRWYNKIELDFFFLRSWNREGNSRKQENHYGNENHNSEGSRKNISEIKFSDMEDSPEREKL